MEKVNQTGKNLSVLILTANQLDWQTFGTWYSIHKYLPEAQVVIGCVRNKEVPFQYFQWIKRLKIHSFHINPFSDDEITNRLYIFREFRHAFQENTLIISPQIMLIDVLNKELTNAINSDSSEMWVDGTVWLSHGLSLSDVNEIIDKHVLENHQLTSPFKLSQSAKEKDLYPIVNIEKGIGRWLHTSRGCPFSNAGNLITENMSINENRIIEMWKKMIILYNTIK